MAETELLRLLPPVLRAREFRLYTQGGRRFVDLWQNGGRAILGHTPPNLLRELKNTASRGLMSPFPHPLEKRFAKALSKLFPDKIFRVYADDASLRRALKSAGIPWNTGAPDPAFPAGESGGGSGDITGGNSSGGGARIGLWRPFLDIKTASLLTHYPLLIPVLPWPLSPRVLVMEEKLQPEFPPSDIISPLILAAATRGIYDLIAAAPDRGTASFPKINKVLYSNPAAANSGEEESAKKWRRRGIYLTYPGLNTDSYAALFRRFLDGGFLLPPGPQEPAILPSVLPAGEEAKLAELLGG
jgi:hypothetical protein